MDKLVMTEDFELYSQMKKGFFVKFGGTSSIVNK